MVTQGHLFILFAAASSSSENPINDVEQSRWRRRTAKRRQRVENLLDFIENGDLGPPSRMTSKSPQCVCDTPTIHIPSKDRINWDDIDSSLDPMKGGNIHNVGRGMRKRSQIDAFYYVISSIVDGMLHFKEPCISKKLTIIDAGCGAGNLAIALAGLFSSKKDFISVLAVDVNEIALRRLNERALSMTSDITTLQTCRVPRRPC